MELLKGDLAVQRFEVLENAICKDLPTEVFYPEKGMPIAETREAVKRCVAECAVRAECLQYATDNHEHGWWGGVSERGRRAFRKSGMSADEWLASAEGNKYSYLQWGRPRNV